MNSLDVYGYRSIVIGTYLEPAVCPGAVLDLDPREVEVAHVFGEIGGEYVVSDELAHIGVGRLSRCGRLAQ